MAIHIRRYHFALVIALFVALSLIGTFFTKEEKPKESMSGALPPLQEVIPKEPKAIAKPALPKPAHQPVQPLKPVVSVPMPSVKRIALTFDDGPHPGYTDRLIQILGENHVHATFFVVGKQAALHPELVEKIFEAGHELANHSYTHRDLRTLTEQELVGELDKTHRLVESITEQKMKFFRPPGGQYNDHVVEEASNLNYTMALWNVLPQDHLSPASGVILERVMKGAKDNMIVLLHSGIENTVAALPEIIMELKDQGYLFVTLSELSEQTASPALVKLSKK